MPLTPLVFALALQAPAPTAQPASASASAPTAVAMAASAPAPPAAAASTPDPPEDPMDHVSCRYQEPEGTYFGSRKVCHTRREWLRLQHAG